MFLKREEINPDEFAKADALVELLSDVPPLAECLHEVLRTLEDPNSNIQKICAAISRDPGLSSRVLRIANSPMFQRGRSSNSVFQALSLMGVGQVKTIVTAAQLDQLKTNFTGIRKEELERVHEAIWKNSLCSAIGVGAISRHLRKSCGDEMFLCALLHDLGKLACMSVIPERYADAALAKTDDDSLVEVEIRQLGFGHPMVGMFVAQKWLFPTDLCDVIRMHHDMLPPTVQSPAQEKAALVQLADLIAHRLGYGYRKNDPQLEIELAIAANRLDLVPKVIEALTKEISELFINQGSLG